MKRTQKMRKYILGALLVIAVAGLAPAQDTDYDVDQLGDKIKAQRVAFITERMKLNSSESERFWSLHNEMEQKQKDIRQRFKPRKKIEEMSESEASQLINDRLDLETELLAIRRDYIRKFRDVVPAKKLVLYERADRDFKLFILEKVRERQQNNRMPQRRPGLRNN